MAAFSCELEQVQSGYQRLACCVVPMPLSGSDTFSPSAGSMSEITELDVHESAKRIFEKENPGRFWRAVAPGGSQKPATLTERQTYLARARKLLHASRFPAE